MYFCVRAFSHLPLQMSTFVCVYFPLYFLDTLRRVKDKFDFRKKLIKFWKKKEFFSKSQKIFFQEVIFIVCTEFFSKSQLGSEFAMQNDYKATF